MQDPADLLRAFMARQGLSQARLANAAGVSQPTVSRALARKAERRGVARSKLFNYAGISEWAGDQQERDARERVIAAFERVWDRSETHADAIARVIEALADLRPRKRGDEEK